MHAYGLVQVHILVGVFGGQRLTLGVFLNFAYSCCWYLVSMLVGLRCVLFELWRGLCFCG